MIGKERSMQTVTSKDGTVIAYQAAGGGPAVVLVGTTAGDHHDLDGLARLLAAGFRVVNYDRRGRGDPSWERMARYAHTLAYHGRIVQGTQDGVPLPAAYRTLPGQDHSALWMAPDAVAASVAELLHATAR
jgi:hypothetical protein